MKNFCDIITSIKTKGFEATALGVFNFQAQECAPYREYLELLGVDIQSVNSIEKIPFLPIELFRSHRVYCGTGDAELEFASSGTTGTDTSVHYVASAQLYRDSFMSGFREFFGSPQDFKLVTMLPCYREGSSLLYMIEELKRQCTGQRVILWGVTFALLEAARSREDIRLAEGSIVLETGGMKGRGREIERTALHAELIEAFGVERIYSEYGMCELLSQGYSSGEGLFQPSSTMRVMGRSLHNPLSEGEVGKVSGLNIIDLANLYSCSFIATGDRGIVHPDGSFEVLGRIEGEILRGCNML